MMWEPYFHSHGLLCTVRSKVYSALRKERHGTGGRGALVAPEREGGAVEEDGRCMIKAYILKSLTSPLVWLMVPASQSDRSKGLEKWCNYGFLNRGPKRPAWRRIWGRFYSASWTADGRSLHPSIPRATHPEAPRHFSCPSPPRHPSLGLMACLAAPL